jgi:hypothetical protein
MRINSKNKNWYVAVPVLVILIIITVFLSRGWLHRTVIPGTVSLAHGHSVQATLDTEYSNLGKPLDILGLPRHARTGKCTMVSSQHFKTTMDCSYIYKSYSDKVSGLKPDLEIRAATLETNLKNKGWTGGNTSISTLGQNINKGIDWTPDASYTKQVGKTYCLADFNTAFSKPKPPALSGVVMCSHTFELF